MFMNTAPQIQKENRPWEDWEDHGGFDDEDSLFGGPSLNQSAPFLERPWYYEKKRNSVHRSRFVCVQMSFLGLEQGKHA